MISQHKQELSQIRHKEKAESNKQPCSFLEDAALWVGFVHGAESQATAQDSGREIVSLLSTGVALSHRPEFGF